MSNRTEKIQIRVTPEMKEKLQSAAATLGLTLSGYLLFKASYDLGYDIADKLVTLSKENNREVVISK